MIDPFFGRSIEIEDVEKIQRSMVTQHWRPEKRCPITSFSINVRPFLNEQLDYLLDV